MQTKNDLHALRGLVIDMDGVLWQADQPLPGLKEFFDVMQRRGIKFILATNNNTMLPEGFVKKAAGMGVEVTTDEIMTASIATVDYLQSRYPQGSRVYVVGETPLKNMVAAGGYEVTDHDVVAVVAAMDRTLTYDSLKRGSILIRAGAEFIGANPDACYPTADGLAPASGAVLAFLSVASGVQPIIIGKPETRIYDICLKRMGLKPEEAASLGDRLDTDIEGGLRIGMKAVLVLSGVTSAQDAAASPIKPTWTFTGIDALAEALE
jgi:4-nitrophenyl phosphatase